VTADQLAKTAVYKPSSALHPLFSALVPNSQHVNVMTVTLFAILQQLLCFLWRITKCMSLQKLHIKSIHFAGLLDIHIFFSERHVGRYWDGIP
jgi:hypothetical protein